LFDKNERLEIHCDYNKKLTNEKKLTTTYVFFSFTLTSNCKEIGKQKKII